MHPPNYLSDSYTISVSTQATEGSDLYFFFAGELDFAGVREPVWMISDFPDRRNARVLAGETLTANAYIHLRPESHKIGEFENVRNYVDNILLQVEGIATFDLKRRPLFSALGDSVC